MNTAAIDAAILTDRMMLEASSLGLGSVWICWSRPTCWNANSLCPKACFPLCLSVRGYLDPEHADPDRHERQRLPMTEPVRHESMGNCSGSIGMRRTC